MTDIWQFHKDGYWAVIPTNMTTKLNKEAVMGAGLALQASQKFPDLARRLGDHLSSTPSRGLIYYDRDNRLICLPTKLHWRDPSTLTLVQSSLTSLCIEMDCDKEMRVALPRLGCGLGGLEWNQVKPLIEAILPSERYVFCDP